MLGLFYDVLRIIRRAIKSGKWLNALFDGVFCLLGAAFVVTLHLVICSGEVRYYTWLGFVFGSGFYFLGMSRLIMAAYEAAAGAAKKVYGRYRRTRLAEVLRK